MNDHIWFLLIHTLGNSLKRPEAWIVTSLKQSAVRRTLAAAGISNDSSRICFKFRSRQAVTIELDTLNFSRPIKWG